MGTRLVVFAYRCGNFEAENLFLEAWLNVRGGLCLNDNVLFIEVIGEH